MIFYACDIPEDLTYDIERDVWIRFDGEIATLGMTDVAQTRCGKFAALSFREVGKKVAQGKALESGMLYLGRPAKAVRALTQDEIAYLRYSAEHYMRLKDDYLKTAAA